MAAEADIVAAVAAEAAEAADPAVADRSVVDPAAADPAAVQARKAVADPAGAVGDTPPPGAPPPAAPPPAPPGGPSSGPPPPPPPRGRPSRPPGLRDQATSTFEAVRGLVDAHVVLAKAELAVIAGDLKEVVAQVGAAIALLLYIGLLVPVGTALFLGEWLFGSLGWGILHGALFSVAAAIVLVLGALRVSRTYLLGTLFLAILLGIAVGTIFGLAWPNAAYQALGDVVAPDVDPAYRPLVIAVALWGAVMALLGIVGGARAGSLGGAIGGFFGGAISGALIGAFTAISFSFQVGVAIGVAVTLAVWPAFAALALRGYDWEDLQRRFTPQASIDAAKETKAFVEARLPGRKDEEDAA